MDQKITGKFIAQMRKEKGLTQAELAELLLISDKTVSKWETGKGLPEVSLMLPLCEQLGITVNELLSGQKLSPTEYQEKAEVNIVNLIEERAETKFRLIVETIVVVITLLAGCTLILMTEYVSMSLGWKIASIVIAVFVLAFGIVVAVLLEMRKAVFECSKCGYRFIPTGKAFVMGAHTIIKRHLKCPHCGVKNMCKRCLSLEKEQTEEKSG